MNPELIRYRRHFHAHPELSLEEHETAAFIERELRQCDFDEIRTRIGKTGILATLRGGRRGPTTLLRADMDALPITELGTAEYRSQHDGVMHACGHDGHMAILLASARALAARRQDVAGTVVFCFQPGEEGYGGNRLMIADGALENPHVDRVFALHLYTGLDVGKVGIRDGPFFAASDQISIILEGHGGHGAMPQLSVDPIVGAAQFITMLQTLVSREVPPKEPVVVTIGRVVAGTTHNVIPDRAELTGTVRTLDEVVRRSMPERIERMLQGLCSAMRMEYRLEYEWGYPAVVNDPRENDVVRAIASGSVGAENIVEPHEVVMWAEDMAYMQAERPGAYFLVGARGAGMGNEPQHSARYDIDERALDAGFRMMTGIAMQ
ncbi:MAG TPA: amidohydrolase [Candidatus Dormibacteraeota bacterium]|nr:amidohydrolase [Candidatus Dormibacteraeota bacterium]